MFVQQTGSNTYWSVTLTTGHFCLQICLWIFFAVWPETGQEVSLLHGILGVIVLQRPWVWNLSSLMHRSALVNPLLKHYGERMEVFWIGCFWKEIKFVISSNNWAKSDNAKEVIRSASDADLKPALIDSWDFDNGWLTLLNPQMLWGGSLRHEI